MAGRDLLGTDHGGLCYPNGISNSEERRRQKRIAQQLLNYYEAEADWEEALRSGRIVEPASLTRIERYIETARLPYDSERRAAARRLLTKASVSWGND
jgi:lipopolysaccharide biosynthesis regulator YciM